MQTASIHPSRDTSLKTMVFILGAHKPHKAIRGRWLLNSIWHPFAVASNRRWEIFRHSWKKRRYSSVSLSLIHRGSKTPLSESRESQDEK